MPTPHLDTAPPRPALPRPAPPRPAPPAPVLSPTLGGDHQTPAQLVALGVFIVLPLLALLVAIPIAWGGWLGWVDVILAVGSRPVVLPGVVLPGVIPAR